MALAKVGPRRIEKHDGALRIAMEGYLHSQCPAKLAILLLSKQCRDD
jgi:hypothetical protein